MGEHHGETRSTGRNSRFSSFGGVVIAAAFTAVLAGSAIMLIDRIFASTQQAAQKANARIDLLETEIKALRIEIATLKTDIISYRRKPEPTNELRPEPDGNNCLGVDLSNLKSAVRRMKNAFEKSPHKPMGVEAQMNVDLLKRKLENCRSQWEPKGIEELKNLEKDISDLLVRVSRP